MGFKLVGDAIVINQNGPTPLTPTGKYMETKILRVSRTNLSGNPGQVLFPADSSIVGVKIFGSTSSDAGTTATVSLTLSGVFAGTLSTGTVDVKANGTVTAGVQMTNLPNFEDVPAASTTGDLTLSAVYAETGTASTTGGPWFFLVEYVR